MTLRPLRFIGLALAATTALALSAAWAQEVSVLENGASVGFEVEGPTLADPAEGVPTLPPPSVTHEAPAPLHVAPSVVHAPAVACHPIAVLREHTALSAQRAYRCHGAPIHQTLCVDNPADGCHKLFSVPVCVPACCVDQPVCVAAHAGLLGRGHVNYRWKCGFEATITFRVHGGVLIAYR